MKSSRQRKILEIIANIPVETQEELAVALRKNNFDVTQATVSRDIKELGLIKIPYGDNQYKYALPQENRMGNVFNRLERLFKDSVTNFDFSENLIVINTLPGTAHAIAACLDHIHWKEVIGTVAGDDTILLIVKPVAAIEKIMSDLEKLFG